MASLSNARNLGGVGGIFVLLSFIPYLGFILAIIGFILILVSMKEISDLAQDRSIFEDGMIGSITAIMSAVIIGVFFLDGAAFGFLQAIVGVTPNFGPGGFLGALLTFGVFDLFAIISGIFLKRAYDKITQRFKVGAFATTGLLYLVGSLTAVVAVGFLIFLIAFIYQIVAYFSIHDQPSPIPYYGVPPPIPAPTPMQQNTQPPVPASPLTPQMAQPQATPTQPTAREFKFCYQCGTRLPFNAVYCTNCGARQ